MGRYDEPKIMFFFILCVSACLDIPSYIGCLSVGTPRDCEWESPSYPVFWCFHLIALCGYAFAIVTPPILWSDIINHKDGLLFRSAFPTDNTKRFFQVMLIAYFASSLMNIISVILYFKSTTSFQEENVYYTVSIIVEACIILSICIGCLVCGVRLQWYVKTVQLDSANEMRFLFRLNVTLLVVLATYMLRVMFILHLVPASPPAFDVFAQSYFTFTLCTRWLPYVVSPLCLVHEMRFSGAEIAARNALSAKASMSTADGEQGSSRSGGRDAGRGSVSSSNDHSPIESQCESDGRDSFIQGYSGLGGRLADFLRMAGGSATGETSNLSTSLLLAGDGRSPQNNSDSSHSPGSRYFLDDSFRAMSGESAGHIDHFGPPSFTDSALHRAFSHNIEGVDDGVEGGMR